MAREASLWQRIKNTGVRQLRELGYGVHLCRIENSVGAGNPDVEGHIDWERGQIWLELKSCARPKRATTPIKPKCRTSQKDWHEARSKAGCRTNFVLIQVGDNHAARLYLIPGDQYALVAAGQSEAELGRMSVLYDSKASLSHVLMRAAEGY